MAGMQFTHYDLGQMERGQIVEITLSGSAANVQLLDSSNLSNYKNGRNYRYIGGLAKKSPVRLQIPNNGHWHVAVDMRGLVGTVRSSIRVLPNPLPTLTERPLSSIPSLVRNQIDRDDDFTPEYDVFISHASEDKDDIVRPLAHSLKDYGLKVWYDEFELKIGDSLRRKIDKGLANSRFGIVVLSRNFIGKGWANYELDGIITRAVSGEQVILPIWHNITKKEVIDYSPSLADKLARNTAINTVDEIAQEIADLINSHT
ncbi:DUF1883 domain-containing protein [Desulfosporosinus youngiae]|uniref:TIR domain-containing protein n=1 Tax=Desulfosporosinus youngiae DSM 17734 TaxID=768710 RepID=H5XYY5_9FIRM|nr:DUF1883 domain-containing protein [Desulfosporosinus youngiae]EHQ91691.1 TIR domain-containing protein [Desulfosporosinus youngiae DSM 17734]